MPIDIRISRSKARELFKHFMIGNWILLANSEEDEERKEKYENFRNWFLSIMKNYKIIEEIEYEEKYDDYFVSAEIEDEIYNVIDEYCEENFWEELTHKLATRDFIDVDSRFKIA